jgi:hypothetical protein
MQQRTPKKRRLLPCDNMVNKLYTRQLKGAQYSLPARGLQTVPPRLAFPLSAFLSADRSRSFAILGFTRDGEFIVTYELRQPRLQLWPVTLPMQQQRQQAALSMDIAVTDSSNDEFFDESSDSMALSVLQSKDCALVVCFTTVRGVGVSNGEAAGKITVR